VRRPAQVATGRERGKIVASWNRSSAIATSKSSGQASQGSDGVSSARLTMMLRASGLK
jgi:hypothetical protein